VKPRAAVLSTLLALACTDAGPSEAPADGPTAVAAVAPEYVDYDVRRLRPRNEETLQAMFDRLAAAAWGEGKDVGVLFSADWCEACRRLDLELGNRHPKDAIGHVRIFEFKEEDWEAVTRLDEFNGLRARWHPVLNSYPVLVLLDREGKKVEEMQEAITRLEAAGMAPALSTWLESRRSG
jgi:hypothetical protein